jgi:hypothetical protein
MATKEVSLTYLDKTKRLGVTWCPTEVLEYLKHACIAMHSDGFGNGVNKLDPRTTPPFLAWNPPDYDPTTDGISASAAAELSDVQRDNAKVSNVINFEDNRRELAAACREEEKALYHPLRRTLSPGSLSLVKQLDIKLFEQAEVARDLGYLVKAIITSHSGSTGLSVYGEQLLLIQRVTKYMTCVKGDRTMGEYLDEMNGHIAAIKSMDATVSIEGVGGHLGPKTDQVIRFLSGSGATVIINLILNGRLQIPRDIEGCCTLISNWAGPTGMTDTPACRAEPNHLMEVTVPEGVNVGQPFAVITRNGRRPNAKRRKKISSQLPKQPSTSVNEQRTAYYLREEDQEDARLHGQRLVDNGQTESRTSVNKTRAQGHDVWLRGQQFTAKTSDQKGIARGENSIPRPSQPGKQKPRPTANQHPVGPTTHSDKTNGRWPRNGSNDLKKEALEASLHDLRMAASRETEMAICSIHEEYQPTPDDIRRLTEFRSPAGLEDNGSPDEDFQTASACVQAQPAVSLATSAVHAPTDEPIGISNQSARPPTVRELGVTATTTHVQLTDTHVTQVPEILSGCATNTYWSPMAPAMTSLKPIDGLTQDTTLINSSVFMRVKHTSGCAPRQEDKDDGPGEQLALNETAVISEPQTPTAVQSRPPVPKTQQLHDRSTGRSKDVPARMIAAQENDNACTGTPVLTTICGQQESVLWNTSGVPSMDVVLRSGIHTLLDNPVVPRPTNTYTTLSNTPSSATLLTPNEKNGMIGTEVLVRGVSVKYGKNVLALGANAGHQPSNRQPSLLGHVNSNQRPATTLFQATVHDSPSHTARDSKSTTSTTGQATKQHAPDLLQTTVHVKESDQLGPGVRKACGQVTDRPSLHLFRPTRGTAGINGIDTTIDATQSEAELNRAHPLHHCEQRKPSSPVMQFQNDRPVAASILAPPVQPWYNMETPRMNERPAGGSNGTATCPVVLQPVMVRDQHNVPSNTSLDHTDKVEEDRVNIPQHHLHTSNFIVNSAPSTVAGELGVPSIAQGHRAQFASACHNGKPYNNSDITASTLMQPLREPCTSLNPCNNKASGAPAEPLLAPVIHGTYLTTTLCDTLINPYCRTSKEQSLNAGRPDEPDLKLHNVLVHPLAVPTPIYGICTNTRSLPPSVTTLPPHRRSTTLELEAVKRAIDAGDIQYDIQMQKHPRSRRPSQDEQDTDHSPNCMLRDMSSTTRPQMRMVRCTADSTWRDLHHIGGFGATIAGA